jgi:hypothetical protein
MTTIMYFRRREGGRGIRGLETFNEGLKWYASFFAISLLWCAKFLFKQFK